MARIVDSKDLLYRVCREENRIHSLIQSEVEFILCQDMGTC